MDDEASKGDKTAQSKKSVVMGYLKLFPSRSKAGTVSSAEPTSKEVVNPVVEVYDKYEDWNDDPMELDDDHSDNVEYSNVFFNDD